MGSVIQLSGDIHQQVQNLLPWYINDTLGEDEAAAVEAHLAECAECRHDLGHEKMLGGEVSLASMDVDQGWTAMRRQIEGEEQRAPLPANVAPLRRAPILRRSIPMGWALGAQAAVLALVILGMRLDQPGPNAAYHALGATPLPVAANMIVIFRPDATEAALRSALVGSHASLVGGPTDSNAYILHVDGTKRASALANLRANPRIVLAEPIDGAGSP